MSTKQTHPNLSEADSLTVAREACRILLQKLSTTVTLISTPSSALTDYYVVGYGRSSTHVRALANDTMDTLAACGVQVLHREGFDSADWILLDFGDVIVHVFEKEAGEFYRFERLFRAEDILPIEDLQTNDEKE